MTITKQSYDFANNRSSTVPFGGLNIVRSRGKWYVLTRKQPSVTFIKGFDGTKPELLDLLRSPDIARLIVKSECGNRKGSATHLDPFRLAVARRLAASCRKRAAEKGIVCQIGADWIYAALIATADHCTLTGLPFDYRPRSKKDGWHKNPFAPSPDRIERHLGYVEGNVRLVLASVNVAINEWGLDHFRDIATFLLKRSDGKR